MCRVNFHQNLSANVLNGGLAPLCEESFSSTKLKPKVHSQKCRLDSCTPAKELIAAINLETY